MGPSRPVSDEIRGAQPRGLAETLAYPLLSAINGRRTRRIARGTSVDAGRVSHASTNPPAPLTALEEAVLIVSTGLTGLTMHDVPLTHPDGRPEFATPLMRVPARAAHVPGVWLQVSHLELEYYEKYFHRDLYERQARHEEMWGRH